MLVSGEGVRPEKFELGAVVASYLCLPQIGWPLLDVAWTLPHEALFYGLFLVPILFGRTCWRIVAAGWLLLIGVVLVRGTAPSFPVSFLTSALNGEFLLGVAAAIAARRWQPLPLRAGALLVFGGTVAAAGFWSMRGTGRVRRLDASRAGARTCVRDLRERRARTGRQTTCAARPGRLGDASSSLYLWHGFVVVGAMMASPRLPAALREWPLLWLVLVGAAAFVSSVLVARWVERPLTRWFRGLLPRLVPG